MNEQTWQTLIHIIDHAERAPLTPAEARVLRTAIRVLEVLYADHLAHRPTPAAYADTPGRDTRCTDCDDGGR